MKKEYKLLDVVHSGRKGLRGTEVCDQKYEGLIGCLCSFDINDIQQFKRMKFDIYDSREYYRWHTSEVLALTKDGTKVEVETANSIYIFEESV